MDADAIEAVLDTFQIYPYGWRTQLPPPHSFFDHPIAITVETSPCPRDEFVLEPTKAEIELVRLILTALPEVLVKAEREYATYNADFPELIGKVYEPCIWICREFQATDGIDRWAFISKISDAPDWTIFLEFRGLTFLEVWSGD